MQRPRGRIKIERAWGIRRNLMCLQQSSQDKVLTDEVREGSEPRLVKVLQAVASTAAFTGITMWGIGRVQGKSLALRR